MAYAYPLMLDVARLLIVIVGGGTVAARKAAGLIDAGATRLRVVAPERAAGFPNSVGTEFVIERYRPGHLDGAGLVFAATDVAEVNDAVVRDARSRGVPVCRADADDGALGDFVVPAKFTESRVTVAVSAGSAALSVRIRDELKAAWDARWSRMSEAMGELRPAILASSLDPARRRAMFRDLAGDEAMQVLEAGGAEALRAWIEKKHA